MAILTYDLRVVGEANINRALASVEQRFVRHQTTVNRTIGGSTATRRAASPGAAVRAMVGAQKQVLTAEQHSQRVLAVSQQRYEQTGHRLKLRNIESRKREEIAALRASNRAAEQERKRFRRALTGAGTGAVGRLAAVGKAGAAMIGVGGSVLAGAAVTQALKLDEQARRLSVAGRGPGEAGMDPEVMRRQFVQTGIASGIAPEQIASGVAAYVAKTGDLNTALANQGTYATVAQASGADVTEVFSAAADLAGKMDIKSVQDMSTAFAILSTQGKKGAFELKAMAAEFPEVFSSAANAGAKGLSGVRDVGAMMQLAMTATGNSSEASTAVNSMFRQLAVKSKDVQSGAAFGGRGVEVFEGGDPTKPMRNFVDVVSDSISAARGNIGQLTEVFDARGIKALNPAISAYRNAYNASGGGKKGDEAGRAAVKSTFSEFRDVTADFKEVERDAADVMKSASVQFEIATEQLKQVFSEELLPVVRELVPHMKELGPPVRDATRMLVAIGEALADHPLAGLGAILATAVAAEVGKAAIALTISQAMTPALMAASMSALRFAGAAGAAAGAVYAAYGQNEALKKETGGKGALDVGWEYLTTDKGLKEIADENLDKQAKAEAEARWRGTLIDAPTAGLGFDPGAGIVASPAAPPQPGTPAGSAATAKVEGGAELVKAAGALTEAAGMLKTNGGAPGSLNRGNSPSPVKG